MFNTRSLILTGFAAAMLAACSSSDNSSSSGSSLPRMSTWTCSDNNRLTVRFEGGQVSVTDTRGIETDLPADPPGQRTRFGKTGFALVFEGRTASWFATGQRPADCRR